jgi:hypothetical protein
LFTWALDEMAIKINKIEIDNLRRLFFILYFIFGTVILLKMKN